MAGVVLPTLSPLFRTSRTCFRLFASLAHSAVKVRRDWIGIRLHYASVVQLRGYRGGKGLVLRGLPCKNAKTVPPWQPMVCLKPHIWAAARLDPLVIRWWNRQYKTERDDRTICSQKNTNDWTMPNAMDIDDPTCSLKWIDGTFQLYGWQRTIEKSRNNGLWLAYMLAPIKRLDCGTLHARKLTSNEWILPTNEEK